MTLRARSVRKVYDGVPALDGVDLAVEPGTCHCLAGPNGSGKTTLLRVLLSLTRPDEGETAVPDGATVGAAFQDASVFTGLTVRDNLDVFERSAGGVAPGWRETVVDELGLEPVLDREAGALSAGFRKRLDLALGLLPTPAYLLVDEPLADVDDRTRDRVVDLLADYPETGRAVLVSTHNLAAFAPACDHLTVLSEGRVVLDTDTADPVAAYHDAVDRRESE